MWGCVKTEPSKYAVRSTANSQAKGLLRVCPFGPAKQDQITCKSSTHNKYICTLIAVLYNVNTGKLVCTSGRHFLLGAWLPTNVFFFSCKTEQGVAVNEQAVIRAEQLVIETEQQVQK